MQLAQQMFHLLQPQILQAMKARSWVERQSFLEEDALVSALPYPKRRHLEEVKRLSHTHRPGLLVHALNLEPILQEARILQRTWVRLVEEMQEEYTGFRTDLLPPLPPLLPEARPSRLPEAE